MNEHEHPAIRALRLAFACQDTDAAAYAQVRALIAERDRLAARVAELEAQLNNVRKLLLDAYDNGTEVDYGRGVMISDALAVKLRALLDARKEDADG
jgi:hypothetical protein